jgi:YHS domain-containing protein
VNLAARVTGAARRNQFLVTNAVQQQVAGLDVELVPVGARSLKGLSQDIDLFEVVGDGDPAKIADPVCGMQLDDQSSEAQLNLEGQRILFCSEVCLRRFLENPHRYVKTTPSDT